MFYNIDTWAQRTELFMGVIYNFLLLAPDKPFQPSPMFVGKARSIPRWSTFQFLHSRVSWPYTQTFKLDWKRLSRKHSLADYENL
jgi:hypothetical protein